MLPTTVKLCPIYIRLNGASQQGFTITGRWHMTYAKILLEHVAIHWTDALLEHVFIHVCRGHVYCSRGTMLMWRMGRMDMEGVDVSVARGAVPSAVLWPHVVRTHHWPMIACRRQ
jgi:hypothetical protein